MLLTENDPRYGMACHPMKKSDASAANQESKVKNMQIRYSLLWPVILSLLCLFACAHQDGPLHLVTDIGRETIMDTDVEEVYLKYDRRDQHYVAVVALNTDGRDKAGRLLKNKSAERMLRLYMGDRMLTEVPVMTDQIDRLLIKFDDQQSAVALLKALSH